MDIPTNSELQRLVTRVCRAHGNDPERLLDIAREIQSDLGCVSQETIDLLADQLELPRVDVESLVSFYSFLSVEPQACIVVRLSDDVVDRMAGSDEVAAAMADELGIEFGETTADGALTLQHTSCIGMSDQAPAALVNDVVVTSLTPGRARAMIRDLKAYGRPERLIREFGDGNNAHELVGAMVRNNLRRRGEVIFADVEPGVAIRRALAMSPAEVIRTVKTARLRGRGGAGFPTGIKWEYTRAAPGQPKYVVCNADEGEPGTFKDRVILTECPELAFEGMVIAGYAIGANEGLVYLRAEYAYLRDFLEHILEEMRCAALLGPSIAGSGFSFDIRIQMGAGAYICGEETALLSSLEGQRGDPKTRPPFPAQKGYRGCPTTVNNVETLCGAARIVQNGAAWFAQMGTTASTGTKLLSVSGDCRRPGVYEFPFGVSLRDVLTETGARDAQAIQVGGPSGRMVAASAADRCICFDDLATGGSVMIFGPDRDVVEIARDFMRFFVHESCGYCTPCRVGNVLLLQRLEHILAGRGAPDDPEYLRSLAETVRATSRCGLGQTSPNPVLSLLDSFPGEVEALLQDQLDGRLPAFDLASALEPSRRITGRASVEADGNEAACEETDR